MAAWVCCSERSECMLLAPWGRTTQSVRSSSGGAIKGCSRGWEQLGEIPGSSIYLGNSEQELRCHCSPDDASLRTPIFRDGHPFGGRTGIQSLSPHLFLLTGCTNPQPGGLLHSCLLLILAWLGFWHKKFWIKFCSIFFFFTCIPMFINCSCFRFVALGFFF